ncbi:MAG: Cadherin-like beta sandwich protein [Acidobacteria bacterium]|nr:Cadherin-like beta sandwich protein [Acidobacteriota bacterium]
MTVSNYACTSANRGLRQRVAVFQHPTLSTPGANFYNHAPTLERLPNGHLVAAWCSGESEGSADYHILLSRSLDEGLTWSRSENIFDPAGDATAWAAVLFSQGERLWMILSLAGTPGSGKDLSSVDLYLASSTDEGQSWSPPRRIDTGKDRSYAPLHKPVLLSDNRLAFGFYWRAFGDPQTHAGVLIANNDLSSWVSIGDVWIPGHRTLEPILTRENDGRLYMFLRTDLDHVYSATSQDEGKTWSTPTPLPIPNADTLSYLVRLDDGQYLVAWNNHPGVRDYLSLGIFSGPDLSELRDMLPVRRQDQRTQAVSYPRVLMTADKILLIYSVLDDGAANRRSGDIWFESFPKALPVRDGELKLDQRPTGVNETLYDVTFSTPTRGWAVGAGGRILSSSDGGRTWTTQTSVSTSDLHTVHFANETAGVVLGDGVVLTTNDGGAHWTSINISANVIAAAFVDDTTSVAVGSRGEILRTTNGGVSFQLTEHCSCNALFDVRNGGTNQMWATGAAGTLLHSRDRGLTWEQLWLKTSEDILGIAFDSTGQRGLAVGDHEVMFSSSNGGASWNKVSPLREKTADSAIPERLKRVVFNALGSAIVISDQAAVWTSSDLIHFTRAQTKSLNSFQAISALGERVFVAGWDGRLFRMDLGSVR